MDYSKFRQQVGQDEIVSVNHRALITRTLTKYPVDYALYRELLQNSADARASSVVINYETTLPGGLSHENIASVHEATVKRLTVKNNGAVFEQDDWNRLREIAKGNPNESKIGAFGVGFYSVFEVTDEPLVHSGSRAMYFYYAGDQLRYRTSTLEEKDHSAWTVIDLPYRTPMPLPTLATFTAFLTQSFVLVPLSSVELIVDGINLLTLKKVSSPSAPLSIPSHINLRTPDRTLTLKSLESESFQITVEYLNVTQMNPGAKNTILSFGRKLLSSFVTSSSDPGDTTSVTGFLRKVSGTISVNVSSQFSRKMKETVMKPPPKEAIVSMLTNNLSEVESSQLKPPMSDFIYPKDVNGAKIFIGFPTKQNTAVKSHLAMNQLIPTMERTAIDMSNQFVKTWNENMLYIAGVIARTVYEHEMASLSSLSSDANLSSSASYIMDKFTFQPSTPDPSVGQWLKTGFWKSSSTLLVPTQQGIKPSTVGRIAGNAKFVRNIPMIPDEVLKSAKEFINFAVDIGILRHVTPSDIIEDVQTRTFSIPEFHQLIEWCADNVREGPLSLPQIRQILSQVVVANDDKTYQLAAITHYQLKHAIDDWMPLPHSCLPYNFIGAASPRDLQALGWKELSIVDWLQFMTSRGQDQTVPNLTTDFQLAVKTLSKIDYLWGSLSQQENSQVIKLLQTVPCIPTQLGMKAPSEAYLQEIPMFPDLPVVTDEVRASKPFLFALGLRESVDMAFVLKLLHDPDQNAIKWSTYDVVKYLTTHRKSLKRADWEVLRTSSFFSSQSGSGLYRARDLYAPNSDLEKLGFKTLKWDVSSWNDRNMEAVMLYELGLQSHPSCTELFAGVNTDEKRQISLRYYLDNYDRNDYGYSTAAKLRVPVVPCTINGNSKYELPSACFTDPESELFGFPVVVPKYRDSMWKLGVKKSPLTGDLISKLVADESPKSLKLATKQFEYLSKFATDLTPNMIDRCRTHKIVPVSTGEEIEMHYPGKVFFDSENEEMRVFDNFKELFKYAKFPETALPFLHKVGVRFRPSLGELAFAVASNPSRAYKLAGSRKEYENFLLELGLGWKNIARDQQLVRFLMKSRFLPGIIEKKESEKDKEYISLRMPSEIAIVDDVIAFDLFKEYIHSAPQITELEKLYAQLGSARFSEISHERMNVGRAVAGNEQAIDKLRKHISERVNLFLERKPEHSSSRAANLSSLNIQLLTSISIDRWASMGSINTPVVSEKLSAWFDPSDKNTLYVTSGELNQWSIDWYDLSRALIRVVIKKPDPEQVMLLEMFLSSDLSLLRRKGINVDRLLKEEKESEERERELERIRIEQERERQKELEKEKLLKAQQNHKGLADRHGGEKQRQLQHQSSESSRSHSDSSFIDKQTPQSLNSAPPARQPNQPNMPPNVPSGGLFGKLKKSFSNRMAPQEAGSNSTPALPGPSGSLPGGSGSGGQLQKQPTAPGDLSHTRSLLQQAVNGTRPFTSSRVNSTIRDVDDKEIEMGCKELKPTELQLVTKLSGGPSLYVRVGQKGYSDSDIVEAERLKTILFALSRVSLEVVFSGC